MINRRHLWFEFCDRHGLGSDCAPLFETEASIVSTVPLGRNQQPVLKRSALMETLVLDQVKLLHEDFQAAASQYEGLIYCMFDLSDEQLPCPLYIGKAEKFGKGDRNLSANLKGIKQGTSHPFARWGYNYAYHLGDLSSVVLAHKDGGAKKYERWANELFEKPYEMRKLKRPIFFWCKAWKTGSLGPWLEFGPTNLTFLEYLLIGVASAEFPQLLNAEGTNRR